FRSRLVVEPLAGSRLVNLRFSAYEPQLAADAVNTLAQLYIQQSLEFRFTTSSEATGWLSDRAATQRQKVEAAERALQDYREREGLVNYDEGQTLDDQKVLALSAAVLQARTERIARESLYNQMRSLPASQLASFPAVLANPIVQGLRTRLGEAQQKQSRLGDTLGERHPDMVALRAEIAASEDKLRAEIGSVLRSVESEYRTALQQEQKLQAGLESAKSEALVQNRKAVEYAILKREVETNQQLLKELMGRSQETGLESGLNSELKSTNIRIVEKAEVPRIALTPQRLK